MINPIENSHHHGRSAIVEIDGKFLPDVAALLRDAGFFVVGSASTRELMLPRVRLLIEGDALPEECGLPGPRRTVSFVFQQQSYGKQVITRVKDIILVKDAEPVAA